MMRNIKEKMKTDAQKASRVRNNITKSNPQQSEIYSIAATLYGEAKDLDNKGITRVAETIRNRYNYYSQNKASGVNKITYRDIIAAPDQYKGFNVYRNKSIKDFQNLEKSLTGEEKKNWDRCMAIARKVVNGQLETNYANGALGFNKASVEANKRLFKTSNVFKDDSSYINNPDKKSPHVFFGDYYMSPLKNAQGKVLAKGGNPNENVSRVLVQNKMAYARNGRG